MTNVFIELSNGASSVRKYNTTIVSCSGFCNCNLLCNVNRFGMSFPPELDRW